MPSDTQQRTLTGGVADLELVERERNVPHKFEGMRNVRPRPHTLLYCPACGEWLLRRARHHHDHPLVDAETVEDAKAIIEHFDDHGGRTFDDLEAGRVLAVGKRSEWPSCTVVYDPDNELDDDDPLDDSPEQVGNYYDVTISKTVEYRFRVPAINERQAEEKAEEWSLDASPADAYAVHTETREGDAIYEDEEAAEEHNLIP